MFSMMPGSVAVNAPGNETRFFGAYVPVPPLTRSCAHEM